jgi:hypothetical protein
VSGYIYYNYDYASVSDPVEGDELVGRQIKSCVGSPPPDALDKSTTNTNLVIDDGRTSVKEVSHSVLVVKVIHSLSACCKLVMYKHLVRSPGCCDRAVKLKLHFHKTVRV